MRSLLYMLATILYLLALPKNIYAQCDKCIKTLDALADKHELLSDEYNKLAENRNLILKDIQDLTHENYRLTEALKIYNEASGVSLSPGFPLSRDIDCAQNQERLRDTIQIISNRLESQERTNKQLRDKVNDLESELASSIQQIQKLETGLKAEQLRADGFKGMLDSIESDAEAERQRRRYAESRLDEANRQYTLLIPEMSRNKQDLDLREKFYNSVWNVYDEHDEYKRCLELKNSAIILSQNQGQILDRLGLTQAQRLNNRSGFLLEHLGRLLEAEVCAYEHRSDLDQIIARLPNLLLIERNEVVRSGARGISTIRTLYDNGEYAAALNLYDKFYPILDSEGFKSPDVLQTLLEAKVGIATIMLWNLADISIYKALLVPGSWLHEVFANRAKTEDAAISMLHEVIENMDADDKLRREASIIIAKYYK